MSAEQMKFLEERKKAAAAAKAAQEAAAEKENKPVASAGGEKSAERRAQDAWKWVNGRGVLGDFTVFFHNDSGAVIELWHGGGSFTFRRAAGAQMKYCSALCSMQDEPAPFVPDAIEQLSKGEGKKVDADINAGDWGKTTVKEGRIALRAKVEVRDGDSVVELHLTPDGFVFVSAEPNKNLVVRSGELLIVPKKEVAGLLAA